MLRILFLPAVISGTGCIKEDLILLEIKKDMNNKMLLIVVIIALSYILLVDVIWSVYITIQIQQMK